MEASTAVSSRLIGAFFVEKGLVTHEQLELALQKQAETGERLGEIIVAEFGVSRLELASVLAEQWAEFERDATARDDQAAPAAPPAPAATPAPTREVQPDAIPVEPQLRRPIGEIFLERGFVTSDDLDRALDVQRETGTRLGEVLVEQGSLSRLDLASALAEQWSTLQKLRPPEPVEPEPWQNGVPAAPSAPAEGSADLRRSVEELAERVRVVEHASAAAPWNEDLRLLADNVRAAIATVEERVTRTASRIEPEQVEALGAALEELRARVQEPSARLDAVERRLGEIVPAVGLEQTFDTRIAELRAAVEAVQAGAVAADDLAALRTRLDEVASRAIAPEALDELRAKIAALAGESSAGELAELRAAVDDLAARSVSTEDLAGLQTRLDEVASRVVAPEALAELRAEVASFARGSSSAEEELAALRATVEELAAGAVSADDLAALRAAVGELPAAVVSADDLAALQSRVEELGSGTVTSEALDGLRAELAALAVRPVAEPEAMEELRERVAAVADRVASLATPDPELAEQLAAVAGEAAAARTSVVSLAEQVEQLAALRPRVDEIAGSLPRLDALDELRHALEELSERVSAGASRQEHDIQIDDLLARVDALAARVETLDTRTTEPSGARLREILDSLRAEIGSLAQRPLVDVDRLESRLAALEKRGPDPALEALAGTVAEQRQRIDGRLDELAAGMVDPAVVDEVRARVGEIADRVGAAAEAEAVEERLAELERRLADSTLVDEIRAELGRLAESTAGERASLERALHARVDEIVAAVPAADDVATLQARLEELAARPVADDELRARVEELVDRVERTGAAAEAHRELHDAVVRLETTHVEGSNAADARLAGVEAALAALDGVEWRLQTHLEESVAVRAAELEHRLENTDRRLEALTALEERIEALKADIDARTDDGALDQVTAELRAELERLGGRVEQQERVLSELPEPVDPTARLDDLALRLDSQARVTDERIGKLGEDLRARTAEAGETARQLTEDAVGSLAARIDGVDHRLDGVASRDEVHGSIAEHAASVTAELEALRRANVEREQSLTERLEAFADRAAVDELLERVAGHARGLGETRDLIESVRAETAGRIDEQVGAVRRDLDGHKGELGERIVAHEADLAALRLQLEELQAAAAGQDEWRDRVESGLNDRVARLEDRVVSEATETRALFERSEGSVRTELGSLGARLDELMGQRHQDLQAARAATDTLALRVDELHGLRAEDAEAAGTAAGELVAHVEGLATALRSESTSAVAAAQRVAQRLDELEGLRADDAEAARIAGAELVARLDDLAIRTATAAAEADRALRSDLYALAATVEEKEAAGIEEREALRAELERAASSIGWRLERIEETLASDDGAQVHSAVVELERRLDQQVAQQEEQVRVTERALRKGLASLGERLADTQTTYVEAGNALRRSIERLGAAVVEADARMADQIPVSDVDGYVAFAPTSEGYRLVQVPGRTPELGATVEIEGLEGPLVVTRFGRSPLPLDSRPCAYLDRP